MSADGIQLLLLLAATVSFPMQVAGNNNYGLQTDTPDPYMFVRYRVY